MTRLRRLVPPLVLLVLVAVLAAPALPRAGQEQTPTVLVVDTVRGAFEIEIYPDDAPKSVAHVLDLVAHNFYRGLRVHWVQPGVVQFGDPQTRDMTKQDAWGRGGSGRSVGVAETSARRFVRGTVGLAYRSNQAPTAADSQLFILRIANPALDGKYAAIGRVTSGLDVVDKLEMADRIRNVTIKSR